MTGWDYVKSFYREHFGIEEWVVELYANLDILQLCASGAGNKSIAAYCDMDLDDIVEILMNTFKFPGWSEDLPVNPYRIFLDCEKLDNLAEGRFISEMNAALLHCKDSERGHIIYKSYWTCRTMKEIEERIADEWI